MKIKKRGWKEVVERGFAHTRERMIKKKGREKNKMERKE